MPHEVIMPALGMAQETGVIVAWRKAEGDSVAIGDPLFDVETDKTTMEVEATHAGTLTEIRAGAGTDIPVGETIAIILAPGDAQSNAAPETATNTEPKPPTPPVTPTAPKPGAIQHKPVTPLAPSFGSMILASPKAKFEAKQRGIDLRRLVDQGIPQPFHVADLDRLILGPSTTVSHAMSELSCKFDNSAFGNFVAWVKEKTGRRDVRGLTLASFACAAFRAERGPVGDSSLILSVSSMKADATERFLRDPDLQGLGSLEPCTADGIDAHVDLALIDLCGTRLLEYKPAKRASGSPVVIIACTEDIAVVTLHFCERDLSLLAAAHFLDGLAARMAEPALHLL
ncbi:MAG: biotin/lipoyl-containing protein [Pseudomonadota bacterium]